MPAPLDLTGRRFGSLTVVSRGPRVKWGRWMSSWICRCDCGATITVPQNRLPHRPTIPATHRIEACDDCRAKPCIICGAPVSASSASNVCSDKCQAEKMRQHHLRSYYKRRADPGFMEDRRERARQRWASLDAEAKRAAYENAQAWRAENRERVNAHARASHEQRMEDPDYRDARRDKQDRWREQNQDKAREYTRRYGRRKRAQKVAREMGEAVQAMTQETNDE